MSPDSWWMLYTWACGLLSGFAVGWRWTLTRARRSQREDDAEAAAAWERQQAAFDYMRMCADHATDAAVHALNGREDDALALLGELHEGRTLR